MTPEHTQHIRKEIMTNGITNTIFNGVIAWLLLRNGSALDLYQNVVGDLLATAFILTFIVGLIIVPINRRKVEKGKLSALKLGSTGLQGLVLRLPQKAWQAALWFALVATAVIGGATVGLLLLLSAGPFEPTHYAIFKGVWAGLLAAIMAWPMILFGLGTAAEQQ